MFKHRQKKNLQQNEDVTAIVEEKLVNKEQLDTLLGVNSLLHYMTRLDYIKEMINDVNEQTILVENVSASSEELCATTEDISNHVESSNVMMNDTLNKTNQNLDKINNTFSLLEDNITQTSNLKLIMDEVIVETKKINELVNVIRDVADETNLLALNASIEAARAGEHGRGFGVVADEIKKLADSSSKQVEFIQNIVNGLTTKIQRTSKEIDHVINSFKTSQDSIYEATSGIKGINNSMNSLSDNITEISANIEEQTAATQEMSSHLMVINDQSNMINKKVNTTGQAFYDISAKVDTIRIKAISQIDNLDEEMMIELTITDHLMWTWRVYNMILGYVKLDLDKVGDHHICRLGMWLKTIENRNDKVDQLLLQIEKPHEKIHVLAKESIAAYNKKEIVKAEDLLKEIEMNSNKVVEYLNQLKTIL